MGFTISESINFPHLGISKTNCYVTIRACFTHFKSGANISFPMMTTIPNNEYKLSARWYLFADKMAITPLKEGVIVLGFDEVTNNPFSELYRGLKAQVFLDKTCVDD